MLKAVTRQANLVDAKIRDLSGDGDGEGEMSTAYFFDHHATPADLAVVVTEPDFIGAQEELVPSVSQGELAHYENVRAQFEGTPDKNDGGSRGLGGGKGKGKERAPAVVVDDDEDANGDAERTRRDVKGKGKAPAAFQDGTASDDDGLY